MNTACRATSADGCSTALPADAAAQALQERALNEAAAYAIHKKCQDASGGDGMTEADAKAKAATVIAALQAGTWAQRGGGGRAGNEEDFILSRLVAYIKAQAKKANASAPSDEDARATAAAIMKSGKPKAQALCAQYRAEWAAKNTSIGDLF